MIDIKAIRDSANTHVPQSMALALCDEIERLRKDSDRYQWLRGQHWVEPEAVFRLGLSDTDDAHVYEQEVDKAIDVAMEVSK